MLPGSGRAITIRINDNRRTALKHCLGTVGNKILGVLNRFDVATVLALGSAVVHKHTLKVVRSACRTSTDVPVTVMIMAMAKPSSMTYSAKSLI